MIVLDANGNGAAETAKAITGAGGKALSFVLDVTERDKCREVAAEIGATVGRVSVLVNNAGINRRNAFTADAQAVIKDWQDIMAVNLNGVFNVTHAFLDQLRASRGRSAHSSADPARPIHSRNMEVRARSVQKSMVALWRASVSTSAVSSTISTMASVAREVQKSGR